MPQRSDVAEAYLQQHAPRLLRKIEERVDQRSRRLNVILIASTMLENQDQEPFTRKQLKQLTGCDEGTETVGNYLEILENIGFVTVDRSGKEYQYYLKNELSHWQSEANAQPAAEQAPDRPEDKQRTQRAPSLRRCMASMSGSLYTAVVSLVVDVVTPRDPQSPPVPTETLREYERKWALRGVGILLLMFGFVITNLVIPELLHLFALGAYGCATAAAMAWTMRQLRYLRQRYRRVC